MTALALAASDLEIGEDCAKRCGPIDSAPAHGASTYLCDTSTAHRAVRQLGPCIRHKACRSPFLAHRHDRSPGETEKKNHRSMFLRMQPGPRFRTCCATTADKNVVKRPRDLILGAEHDRNQQGARSFLGLYSRAARGKTATSASASASSASKAAISIITAL